MTAVKEKLNRDIVTCGPCSFQTICNQAIRCHDQAVESRKMWLFFIAVGVLLQYPSVKPCLSEPYLMWPTFIMVYSELFQLHVGLCFGVEWEACVHNGARDLNQLYWAMCNQVYSRFFPLLYWNRPLLYMNPMWWMLKGQIEALVSREFIVWHFTKGNIMTFKTKSFGLWFALIQITCYSCWQSGCLV